MDYALPERLMGKPSQEARAVEENVIPFPSIPKPV